LAGLLGGFIREPSSLSRSSTASLVEWISQAGINTILSLSDLQRCILWEIAREAYNESKKREPEPETGRSETMTEAQEANAAASATAGTASSSAPEEPPPSSSGESQPQIGTTSTDEKKPKDKSKEGLKKLMIHLISTTHSMTQSLAKALGGRHRARDERIIHILAQTIVSALRDKLVWTPTAFDGRMAIRCAYLASIVGEMRSFFFDERHNCTHTVLVHQFKHCVDGIGTFLEIFNWVVEAYTQLQDKEEQGGTKNTAESGIGKGKEKLHGTEVSGSRSTPTAMEKETESNEDQTESGMIVGALLAFGSALECLVCGPMVTSSPITVNMMTQTLPGQQGAFDSQIFLGALQSRVLLGALPIWNHPRFFSFPRRFIVSLLHANRYILDDEAAAAAAAAASNKPRQPPKPKKQFEPDRGVVNQLMEMGFTQKRAEDALRHIGANNVELAMDWIFSNPEPIPADVPSDSVAATSSGTDGGSAGTSATEPMSEDEELAAALAMSLGQTREAPPAAASSSESLPPPFLDVPESKAEETPKKEEPVDYKQHYEELRNSMLERCLQLTSTEHLTIPVAEVLVSICKPEKPEERQKVVDALAHKIKLAAAQCPPNQEFYCLTHVLSLLLNENHSIRGLVAESSIVPVVLDLLQHLSAGSEEHSKEEDSPKWLATILLVLDTLCQLPAGLPTHLPEEAESTAPSSAEGKSEGKEDHPSVPEAVVPLIDVPQFLSVADRKKALEACVKLMQRPLLPESMQALLLLTAHITRNYVLSQRFLELGGLSALLDLPATSRFEGLTSLANTILRHVIEEPSLLQHTMESEIKANITKLTKRGVAVVKPKNFLSNVTPVVCRDPALFLRASANMCRLRDPKQVSPSRYHPSGPLRFSLLWNSPSRSFSGWRLCLQTKPNVSRPS